MLIIRIVLVKHLLIKLLELSLFIIELLSQEFHLGVLIIRII